MKALLLSDFHFCKSTIFDRVICMVNSIIDVINNQTHDNILILNLGDIVDKADHDGYEYAKSLYNYMINKINKQCYFAFVPGNHDLYENNETKTFQAFDRFANQFAEESFNFDALNSHLFQFNGNDLILTNSVFEKDHKKASLDYSSIYSEKNTNSPCILLAHHGIITGVDNNNKQITTITTQDQFINMANSLGVHYFLHGHTHVRNRFDHFPTLDGIKVIGVGPAFEALYSDVPQFMMLDVEEGEINNVEPYFYSYKEKKYIARESKAVKKNDSITQYEGYQDYIQRYVMPIKGNTNQSSGKEKNTLLDLLNEFRHLVLLGEGGCGKTYELDQLASVCSNNDEYVFKYSCKDYDGEKIEDLVVTVFPNVDTAKVIYVFDAYDETDNTNLIKFAKQINLFSAKNPKCRIIVSTRWNFYRTENENSQKGTFNGFLECCLCSITKEDITNYLVKSCVNPQQFFNDAINKSIESLIYHPFYLTVLSTLYKTNNELPKRNKIIEKLIDNHFQSDIVKYEYKDENISDNLYKAKNFLYKIAFIIHCSENKSISVEKYQQMFSDDERKLIKLSGVFSINNNKGEFTHNLIREYCTAKYLSTRDLETVKKIICIPEKNVIRESWCNVVSFLIGMYDDELIEWISNNTPKTITMMESTSLSPSIKIKVFNSVFNTAQSSFLRISFFINNIKEFSNYIESKDEITRLVNIINTASNNTQIINAIEVISNKNNLFSQEKVVVDSLINKISDNTAITIATVNAFSRLQLFDKVYVNKILGALSETNYDNDVFSVILEYLYDGAVYEDYFDFVIDRLLRKTTKYYYQYNYSVRRIFTSVKRPENIEKILRYLITKQRRFYKEKEIIEYCCKEAAKKYINQQDFLFLSMKELLVKSNLSHNKAAIKAIQNYFIVTNTVYDAFLYLTEKLDAAHLPYALFGFIDEKCEIELAKMFESNALKDKNIFTIYVSLLPEDNRHYAEFVKLIKTIEGKEYRKPERIDYTKCEIEGMNRYFKTLFDPEEYNKLIEFYFDETDKEKTIKEIWDEVFSVETVTNKNALINKYCKERMIGDIHTYFDEEEKLLSFINKQRDKMFFTGLIYNQLQDNQIVVDEKQKEYIYGICKELMQSINPKEEILYTYNKISYSWRCLYVASFLKRFNFIVDDSYINKLIYLSDFLINEETDCYSLPNYIIDNYSPDKIRHCIINNISKEELTGDLAIRHIVYCSKHHLSNAKKLATSIISDSKYSEYKKQRCLQYMIEQDGENEVIKKFLPTDDSDIVTALSNLVSGFYPQIEEALIKLNELSKNKLGYLAKLIKMNSKYGLKKYLEFCSINKTIPDDTGEHSYAEITESVSEVDDITNLELLCELIVVLNSHDFKDKRIFGLHNSLFQAIKNLTLKDYLKVKDALNCLKIKNASNESLCQYCNYLLIDIENYNNHKNDNSYTEDEINQFLVLESK